MKIAKGLSIAGLVMGTVGLICSIVALALSGAGLNRANHAKMR
ncbi:MAG: hypothetical protein PHG02_06590 [Oscillospiraceae bacterium]|nr:hypothetical protein [Oscillospiraceae bacterium]